MRGTECIRYVRQAQKIARSILFEQDFHHEEHEEKFISFALLVVIKDGNYHVEARIHWGAFPHLSRSWKWADQGVLPGMVVEVEQGKLPGNKDWKTVPDAVLEVNNV